MKHSWPNRQGTPGVPTLAWLCRLGPVGAGTCLPASAVLPCRSRCFESLASFYPEKPSSPAPSQGALQFLTEELTVPCPPQSQVPLRQHPPGRSQPMGAAQRAVLEETAQPASWCEPVEPSTLQAWDGLSQAGPCGCQAPALTGSGLWTCGGCWQMHLDPGPRWSSAAHFLPAPPAQGWPGELPALCRHWGDVPVTPLCAGCWVSRPARA